MEEEDVLDNTWGFFLLHVLLLTQRINVCRFSWTGKQPLKGQSNNIFDLDFG